MWTYTNTTAPLANHVKVLRKLVPICAWCKCIRNEEGCWNKPEEYFHAQANADFTHTICPTCLEKERHKLTLLKRGPASISSPVSRAAAIAC
jgi:hypothetical protein